MSQPLRQSWMKITLLGVLIKMDRTARLRRWNEDVIWRTRLEMQEWNLNQRAREQDVREADLRRREHTVQRHEAQLRAELRAARIRGRGRGRG